MKRKELPTCTMWSFQSLLRHLLSVSSMRSAEITCRYAEDYITILYGAGTVGDAQYEAMRTLLAVAWDTVKVRLDCVVTKADDSY